LGCLLETCIEIWWFFLKFGENYGYLKISKSTMILTLLNFYCSILAICKKERKKEKRRLDHSSI
jgi:hypothetical protein